MKRIRVLMAILGVDQHEVGAVTVSKYLMDAGIEVVYGGKFLLPPTIVKMAVEEDVDLIGLSCHSWEYLHFVPELVELLEKERITIPVVVGGSVVTEKDKESILQQGVSAAFGPMATAEEIVECIGQIVKEETE